MSTAPAPLLAPPAGIPPAVVLPRGVTAGQLARWLLLLGTMLGLATMHTTGHSTAPHTRAALAASTHSAGHPAGSSAADQRCTANDCHRHGRHGTSDRHHHGGSVCLAVLTGLAFVLLGVLLIRRRPAHRRDNGPATIARRAPTIPVMGMTLISATVLRI